MEYKRICFGKGALCGGKKLLQNVFHVHPVTALEEQHIAGPGLSPQGLQQGLTVFKMPTLFAGAPGGVHAQGTERQHQIGCRRCLFACRSVGIRRVAAQLQHIPQHGNPAALCGLEAKHVEG